MVWSAAMTIAHAFAIASAFANAAFPLELIMHASIQA
jgi:hypothetical protein